MNWNHEGDKPSPVQIKLEQLDDRDLYYDAERPRSGLAAWALVLVVTVVGLVCLYLYYRGLLP